MTATAATSSKRVEAERRDAQESTGPSPAESQGKFRFNAVTHGLTAASSLAGEDEDEMQDFRRRAEGRGVSERITAAPESGKAVLLALIDEATTRLEALLADEGEREAIGSRTLPDQTAFDDTPDGELLRRYLTWTARNLIRALDAIFKVRTEPARDPAEDAASPEPPDGKTPSSPPSIEDADETNPTPPPCPSLSVPLDPCSEGRHDEPPIDQEPPPPTIHPPGPAARPRASRTNVSGSIPPMIVQLLSDLQRSRSPLPTTDDAPIDETNPTARPAPESPMDVSQRTTDQGPRTNGQ